MKLIIRQKKKNEYVSTYRYKQIDEQNGVCASTALICIRGSRFAGKFIPTMTIADVSTLPEYRRRGLVRQMFTSAHQSAREYGAYISLLHPFSFDFYRKFGYEKISDTVSATFELSKIENEEGTKELVLLNEKHYDKVLELFRKFSTDRNLMFDRYNISAFLRKKAETYLCFDGDILSGYIVIEKDTEKCKIIINEIVFDSTKALTALISHLACYKNEFKIAEICDIEPIPEIKVFLEKFEAQFNSRGDLMARLLDTEGLLLSYNYPDECGTISFRVEDDLENVKGSFKVTYGDQKCTVVRISDDDEVDISTTAPALLRLLYGCEGAIDEIDYKGDKSELIRLFPRRTNGLFEHF